MLITVICHREGGMIRAGLRHEGATEHLVTAFTPAQLREMLDERALTVVAGRLLTKVDVLNIEEERKAAAALRDARGKEGNDGAAGAATSGAPAAAEPAAEPAAPAAPARPGKARA